MERGFLHHRHTGLKGSEDRYWDISARKLFRRKPDGGGMNTIENLALSKKRIDRQKKFADIPEVRYRLSLYYCMTL